MRKKVRSKRFQRLTGDKFLKDNGEVILAFQGNDLGGGITSRLEVSEIIAHERQVDGRFRVVIDFKALADLMVIDNLVGASFTSGKFALKSEGRRKLSLDKGES